MVVKLQSHTLREKFPLIPNSIYGNKTIKGYENAMRSISIEEILGRVNKIIES